MRFFEIYRWFSLYIIPVVFLFLPIFPLLAEKPLEPLVLASDNEGVQRATLVLESYVYTPHDLVVEAGKPVEFTLKNESFLVPHTFLLDSPDGERLVEETVQFTLAQPGVYPFYCDKQLLFFPNHREEGMEGRITVS